MEEIEKDITIGSLSILHKVVRKVHHYRVLYKGAPMFDIEARKKELLILPKSKDVKIQARFEH